MYMSFTVAKYHTKRSITYICSLPITETKALVTPSLVTSLGGGTEKQEMDKTFDVKPKLFYSYPEYILLCCDSV